MAQISGLASGTPRNVSEITASKPRQECAACFACREALRTQTHDARGHILRQPTTEFPPHSISLHTPMSTARWIDSGTNSSSVQTGDRVSSSRDQKHFLHCSSRSSPRLQKALLAVLEAIHTVVPSKRVKLHMSCGCAKMVFLQPISL